MPGDFVFLHGGGQGSWVWHETLDAMRLQSNEQLGRLFALDVPGCGVKRGHDTSDLEVPDIVAALIGDIDAAGIERAILVGHSQAGTMMPRMIKARPDLFSQAVYVSCLVPTGGQTALDWHTEMPEDGSALLHDLGVPSRQRYRAMFCNDMSPDKAEAFLDKLGYDQWPASSYRMTGWNYDHLGVCPGTFVLCLRDASLVPSWQTTFADRLGVEEIVHIDAGHQVMNTRPHALAEVLLSRLATRA